MKSAQTIFRSIVKNKNFMTPDVVSFKRRGNYVFEIASGEFMGKPIFGVTVVNVKELKHDHDLSKGGFESLELAEEYMESIK